MKQKQKCWEYMHCSDEQTCAAFPDHGEDCWRVAGTMRSSESEERMQKLKQRMLSENPNLTEQDLRQFQTSSGHVCKFVERYGICKCCPYYQFMDQLNRESNQKFFSGEGF